MAAVMAKSKDNQVLLVTNCQDMVAGLLGCCRDQLVVALSVTHYTSITGIPYSNLDSKLSVYASRHEVAPVSTGCRRAILVVRAFPI
jgi:hypothetical protein